MNMAHQKRTACDRCRAHKLRCVREGSGGRDSSRCIRCARAGVPCVIGRPARSGTDEFWINPEHRWPQTLLDVDADADNDETARKMMMPPSLHEEGSNLKSFAIEPLILPACLTYPTTREEFLSYPPVAGREDQDAAMADGNFDLGFRLDTSELLNHDLFENHPSGKTHTKSPESRPTSSRSSSKPAAPGTQRSTTKRNNTMCALAALISSLTEHLQRVSEGRDAGASFVIGNVQEFLCILDDMPATALRDSDTAPGPGSDTPDTAVILLITICYTIIVRILRHAWESRRGRFPMLTSNESRELQDILGLSPPVDNPGLQAVLVVQTILYFINRAESFLGKSPESATEPETTTTAIAKLVRSTMRLDEIEKDVAALREDMERVRTQLGS